MNFEGFYLEYKVLCLGYDILGALNRCKYGMRITIKHKTEKIFLIRDKMIDALILWRYNSNIKFIPKSR